MKNQYRQGESKKITIKAQYTQSEGKEIHQTLRSQLFGLTKGIGSLYQSDRQNLQSAFNYQIRLLKATNNQTFNRMLYGIAWEGIEANLIEKKVGNTEMKKLSEELSKPKTFTIDLSKL